MKSPSLAELAALQADRDLPLKQPLTPAAVAAITESLRLLNQAANRIDAASGELQHLHVPVAVTTFRQARDFLDKPYADLSRVLIAHLDAVDAAKGRSC